MAGENDRLLTVDLDGSRGSMYVWLVAGVAALGGLLFGYDTGVISGAIGFLAARFELGADAMGFAASSALLGCVAGAAFAGALSDWLGRRRVLLLCAVLFAVSAIWSALPQNLAQFVAARIIGGLGVGAASMLSPLYIAEVSPASIRGRLVSINQLAIVTGILVVYFVNFIIADLGEAGGLEDWNVAYGWRWMFGSETLPAVLFFVLLFLVPESPRWLVKQGREDDALRVLERVGGASLARLQVREISEAITREERSVLQLLGPGLRSALMIGIGLAVLQQAVGINAVMYFAPEIFKSAGFGATSAIGQTVVVGAVNFVFTFVAIWLVDKAGRRPLLLTASVGMAFSLFALGGAFAFGGVTGPWVLLLVLAYVAFFALAMGPVVWVVISEIFPTRVRGTAMSIATVCLWSANVAVTQLFPRMLEQLHGKLFFVYGLMCVVSFVFVLGFVPETRGRTLEEIERRWLPRATT